MDGIIKKKLFKSIMNRGERVLRAVAPLAYLITGIVQKPNQPQKLMLVQEMVSLLFYIGDASDEMDLETCHFALRSCHYHQNHESNYPTVFKINKIIRSMVALSVKNLNPKESEIDRQFLNAFVKELVIRCFSSELGKNFCMPSSPEHRKRVSFYFFFINF